MEISHRLSWIDRLVLVGLPIVAGVISVLLNTPYLVSILLFYGAPGFYVAFRFGHTWQAIKGFLFAVITSLPFAVVVDYIGTASGVWYVPKTLFSGRFLDVIPVEDMLWMFCATYTVVMLYEVFCDKGKHELVDRRMRYFVILALSALGVFFLAVALGNSSLFAWQSRYTYLALGALFFLLPALLFLWRFPQFRRRSLPLVGYFLSLTVAFEFTATTLGQWVFTGKYLLPPLIVFANNPIPYEELFFVGIVGPLTVVALYEFFDDDRQ